MEKKKKLLKQNSRKKPTFTALGLDSETAGDESDDATDRIGEEYMIERAEDTKKRCGIHKIHAWKRLQSIRATKRKHTRKRKVNFVLLRRMKSENFKCGHYQGNKVMQSIKKYLYLLLSEALVIAPNCYYGLALNIEKKTVVIP